MPISRRRLVATLPAALLPRSVQAADIIRLEDFGGRANGEDASQAFGRALAVAARTGAEVLLDEGTTVIAEAPGTIINAAIHTCPQVEYNTIRIRGLGSRRSRIVCVPRPTAVRPDVDVSRPILKSVGASHFSLSGVTLDGGFRKIGRVLRRGPDPTSASLVEVRGATYCEISDVVLTGFAGHMDERDPGSGAFGRRGPLLAADCERVLLDRVTVEYPTFREGVFVHNCRRVMVRGFRLDSASVFGGDLSTPLNVFGPKMAEVQIEDFSAVAAWAGSLLNLGGSGRIVIRRLRAEGGAAAAARVRLRGESYLAGGRGIDVGAEITSMMFPEQKSTDSCSLEDVVLNDVARYGIKATRGATCPLKRLDLGENIQIAVNGSVLDASFVDEINGTLRGRRWIGASAGLPALILRDCGSGALAVDLMDEPGPDVTVCEVGGARKCEKASFGAIRVRAGQVVLSGKISSFERGGLLDDVRPGEDALHDAAIENLDVSMPSGASAPAIRMGRGAKGRLRVARIRGCRIGGQLANFGDPGFEVHAKRIES